MFKTKLEEQPVIFDAPVAGHQLWVLRAMNGKGRDAWLTFTSSRTTTRDGVVTITNFEDLNATLIAGVMFPARLGVKGAEGHGTPSCQLSEEQAKDAVEAGLVPAGAKPPFLVYPIKGEGNPPPADINALPSNVVEALASQVRNMNGLAAPAVEKK